MKRITGHLTEKNKKWYAVINLYDTDGKRKEKWQGLNLDANKGNKREAEHASARSLINTIPMTYTSVKICPTPTKSVAEWRTCRWLITFPSGSSRTR